MRSPARRTPIWLAALLVASACPAGGGDKPIPITAGQACAELASARCALISACSLPDGADGPGEALRQQYGDLPTCLARETMACANELAAPDTGKTPVLVQKCVAAFTVYDCADLLNNRPPGACTPVGARGDGAPCTFDSQCQSGACTGNRSATCGTCGEPIHAGESCAATRCLHGERCLASTAACAAIVPAGGACDDSRPCDRSLVCLGADEQMMKLGLCSPAATRVGADCGDATRGCDPTRGLTCARVADGRRCVSVGYAGTTAGPDGGTTAATDGGAPGPTPAGTPCGQLVDGSQAVCVAGTCVAGSRPATTAELGTCLPLAADGDYCVLVAGPDCMPPARCVAGPDGTTGTCLVPTAAPVDSCPTNG